MKIHSVESLAAVDGEGLRYAVFFGRCNLRCVYCHNPDTWCSQELTEISPDALVGKIKRYIPYFISSGGGVTFSGGEPLLYAKDIAEIGEKLKKEGIGYTIDTSCSVALDENVKRALLGAELVICDVKFFNAGEYRKYTSGNIEIAENVFSFLKSSGKRIWLRTVIVPGINDTEEHIEKYALYAREHFPEAERYELLGFHTMGFFKYERMNIINPLRDTLPMDKDRLELLQKKLDSFMAL